LHLQADVVEVIFRELTNRRPIARSVHRHPTLTETTLPQLFCTGFVTAKGWNLDACHFKNQTTTA
jgi:hypothetical protein